YYLVKKYVTEHELWEKFNLIQQIKHNYQCCGRYMGYMLTDDDEIICNVDGDDWLYDIDNEHQFRAFEYINDLYKQQNVWSSYGCYYLYPDMNWMETKSVYPSHIIDNKKYRLHNYLCCHLRTGFGGLYKNIKLSDIINLEYDNNFITTCTDISVQYPVLEMAGNKHANVLKPMYVYNKENSMQYNNSWF